MSIITIDFETYYDKEYSLSKMTTEEYINDPRFEVIGVGIKMDDDETEWFNGREAEWIFKGDWYWQDPKEWADHAILCHNTLFDGAILAWRYGIKPGMWLDTLSMARAIHGVDAGGSLKALASRYEIGEKGDEVINALGKRLADFSQDDLARYGRYCRNDVDLTYKLFHKLQPFHDNELRLIDLTLRMYMEPTLQVDDALLVERLEQVKLEKHEMLSGLMQHLNCEDEEAVRKQLASNPKFAQILKSHNVTVPMKVSATTGKETYALAKTDQGFIDLQEHPDPIVQQLCAVRLGTKSTIEESRIERFIGIGSRNSGRLPVPLRYYGAHTGRWSGLDSVNFQNLPSRDKAKKALKNAIIAPPGHMIINCDSSQIEARILAWLAEQEDLVEQFRKGEDVYSTFATKVYKRPISKADPVERFVGKTCILGLGYGTGAAKLQHTLSLGGAHLEPDKCQEIVNLYRQDNYRIPELWREYESVLKSMLGGDGELPLPNGLSIRYPNLQMRDQKMIYESRKGPVNIWGGAVTENIVQALARIVVGQQMIWLAEHYRPVLTVHDAAVLVVHEDELEDALSYVKLCMSTPPGWAVGLPVACEAKYGRSYGDC
jgi:DNA polymerase